MKYTDRKVKVPLCSFSTISSLANKTGSWKSAQPLYIDRVSPCTQQCPAGEDITGYMYLVSQGRFEEAWRLIMEENPFPAIMGRVCFHPCEEACNRREHDEALSIHMVERFIGDYGLSHSLKVTVSQPEKGKKVAIVGAGPAGLSTAYHLRRMGYNVTIFDSNQSPGGIMRYGIPAYRLPKDILDEEINRLYEMGIEFRMGVKVGEDLDWDSLESRFDALFIAIGAYSEKPLKIDGLNKKGILKVFDFLKEINLGNRPKIGNRVAIIGGGNSGIDCARASRRLGAKGTIIDILSEEDIPAHVEEIEAAREEGIRFIFNTGPIEVYGKENLTGIKLKRVDDSETLDIDCNSMIIAIGESALINDLPPFIAHEGGVVKSDQMGQTTNPKLFAGGDIIDIPHSVTNAIGSGKRAAIGIDRFLRKVKDGQESLDQFKWGDKGNISFGRLNRITLFTRRNPSLEVIDYDNLNLFYFDPRPRMKIHKISVNKRLKGFQEVIRSPSQEEVISEAKRCFNCGTCTECGNCYIFCPDNSIKKDPDGYGYMVDMDYCKGCGICVQECPRGAMRMELMES
jgi:NADPH-dependent glutamate synthase beta subunit-like oxidoreductase/Pyruvate/2-oxoacid:ferredoxin oxidoreductase delta subunit